MAYHVINRLNKEETADNKGVCRIYLTEDKVFSTEATISEAWGSRVYQMAGKVMREARAANPDLDIVIVRGTQGPVMLPDIEKGFTQYSDKTLVRYGYNPSEVLDEDELDKLKEGIEGIRAIYGDNSIDLDVSYAAIEKTPYIMKFIEEMDLTFCEYCEGERA